jgi:hypothetical protein
LKADLRPDLLGTLSHPDEAEMAVGLIGWVEASPIVDNRADAAAAVDSP